MVGRRGVPAQMTEHAEPRPARLLGYLGLLPFVGGAVAVWVAAPGPAALAERALLAYAAIILSFMGAVHWGLAMHSGHPARDRQLALSVVPALIAWVTLLLPPLAAFPVMLLSFAALNAADWRAVEAGAAPAWYPSARLPLTVAVVTSLGVAWLRVLLS